MSPWSPLSAFVPFVHTAVIETDTSKDAIGAFCPTSGHWFSHRLTGAELASAMRANSRAMGELELRAVAMAVATFAKSLNGSALLCRTTLTLKPILQSIGAPQKCQSYVI